MILKCPDCQKQYNIDESRIPSGVKQAKCKACGKNILFKAESVKPVKVCPKCGHKSEGKQQAECSACGIIYAKFSSDKVQKPKQLPVSHVEQRQSAPPLEENTPELRKITILVWAMSAIICLVAGYFAGREHVKYELRQTLKIAAEGVTKSFNTAFLGGVEPEKKVELPNQKPKEPAPFSVVLNNKVFQEADFEAGRRDAILFSLNFKNLTGKDIRAFDGKILFTDMLDNIILYSGLAVNDPIFSGGQIEWIGEISYNQFMDSHQGLKNADFKNIKINFNPKKILFFDGSTKEFDK
ncbi:zinc-ribbon domain-containing protein [Candidatus Electronema sp. JC]|uniref:zinc-ribbon domain-containing protein n=1 Tax=Candidatus Electronema sp. JC TaxID=3401570 RepID=UPI003B43A478